MKENANLAQIVTSRTVKSPPLLDLNARKPSLESQLVQALATAAGTTAVQLAKQLYGSATPSHVRNLQKLASRMQAKLLNHLYFLDHTDPRLRVARRYEVECLDLLHKATLLYYEGEYALSERLLKRCLREAEAGEFTQYATQAAQLLRNLYAEQRQEQAYRAMSKRLEQLRKTLAVEQEADVVYADTRLVLALSVAARRAFLPNMMGNLAKLDALHRRVHTFNTFNYVYQLRLFYEELRGNYEEVLRVATLAARRLQEGKMNERRFDRRFNHFAIIFAYLQTRQPLQGLKMAALYVRDFHPTSSNWLYFQEHHLLLALHAGRYELARQLLTTCTGSQTFGKLREAAKERWELYEGYLDFVQPSQRLNPQQRRRRERWTLTLPEYSRDKRGYNLALLVLQVLHYIRLGDLETLMSRMESVRKYRQRHLREEYVTRPRLFLGLLLVLLDKSFDANAAEERGQTLLRKLKATPVPGSAYAETEIIPYEDLWALVLDEVRAAPLLG